MALYRPDFTLTGTGDPSEYPARESRFWVGEDGDPSRSTADAQGWRGMSTEIAEHSSVTSLPFVTWFGTGHGRGWAHQGKRWQTGDWNNLSAQDVLPTWRWIVDGSALSVDYDYERVWHGGSSVRITGSLDRPTTIPLYATRFDLDSDTSVELVMSGPVTVSAVLRFLDDPETDVVVAMGDGGVGWRRLSTGDLAAHAGRTLVRLGVLIEGSGDVVVRLGELRVVPGPAIVLRRPRHVVAERSRPGYRVFWRGQSGVRYDVEAVHDDGSRTWLGATTGEAFYVAAVTADVHELAVVAIAADGRRGPIGVTTI